MNNVVEWFEKELKDFRINVEHALNIITNKRKYTEKEFNDANEFYMKHKDIFTRLLHTLYERIEKEPIIIEGKWEDTHIPFSNIAGESKTRAERDVFYIKPYKSDKRKFYVIKIHKETAPHSRYGFVNENQIKVTKIEYEVDKY